MDGVLEPNKTDLAYQTGDMDYGQSAMEKFFKNAKNKLLKNQYAIEAEKKKEEEEKAKKQTKPQENKPAATTETPKVEEEKPTEEEAKTEIENKVEEATGVNTENLPPAERSQYSRLSRWITQAYLNGELGDINDPKTITLASSLLLNKIGSALVNAGQVARGSSPTAQSEWSKLIEAETDKMLKDQAAGYMGGKTYDDKTNIAEYEEGINATRDAEVKRTESIQARLNSLRATKADLQTQIAQLRSNPGAQAYADVMNAYVGTVKGIDTTFSNTAANVSSGKTDYLGGDGGLGLDLFGVVKANAGGALKTDKSTQTQTSAQGGVNLDTLAKEAADQASSVAELSREKQIAACEDLANKLEDMVKNIDENIKSYEAMLAQRGI